MRRVSVGLPVYNGERFVAEAIESILGQTLEDLELIISDNASSDRTEEICRLYEKDERVRYVRNRANYGAAQNYNQTFRLSGGELFKWAAHDDVLAPELLERCVETLDRNPAIVIAYPRWKAIDEMGRRHRYASWDVSSDVPHRRLAAAMAMAGRGSLPVFGVIRSDVLRLTRLQPACLHGDHVLLAELSLHGPFLEIDDELLMHRWHGGRYASLSPAEKRAWWGTGSNGGGGALARVRGGVAANSRRGLGYLAGVLRSPIGGLERVRSVAVLFAWAIGKMTRRARRLIRGDDARGRARNRPA
jgi:glycosyltransferase involved in cell wall biosynthesis